MTTLSTRARVATIAALSAALVTAPSWTQELVAVRPTAGAAAAVQSATPAATPATLDAATYADGVYTATGQYGGLPSSITVTVTLVDGVITTVEVTPHATNPTSLDLQQRFAAAVPAVVVGKPLDEVYVGRLAGSSGTPEGFNAAIQQIKEQAMSAAAQLATPVATPVATPDGETA